MSYSFFVSAHCTLMCGPILGAQLSRCPERYASGSLLYNCGRTISYTLMGALLGSLGMGVTCFLGPLQKAFAMVAGIILVLNAAKFFFTDLGQIHFFPRTQAKLSRVLTKRIAPLSHGKQCLALGLVTVLLPCATLAPAMLASAATSSVQAGSVFMLAFVAGSWPAMLATAFFPGLWAKFSGGKVHRLVAGSFLLIVAGIIIHRGVTS